MLMAECMKVYLNNIALPLFGYETLEALDGDMKTGDGWEFLHHVLNEDSMGLSNTVAIEWVCGFSSFQPFTITGAMLGTGDIPQQTDVPVPQLGKPTITPIYTPLLLSPDGE